ncbi:hypothetical protein ABZ897_50830 [Nonomuraea sp. NPDC046802]|uniref:hypothetical protein n=1 Tax=Nonomuraea sp. NPDC046802 TaxID=3154919 RepID=UPI0033D71B4D
MTPYEVEHAQEYADRQMSHLTPRHQRKQGARQWMTTSENPVIPQVEHRRPS